MIDAHLSRPLPAGIGTVTQWFDEHPEHYQGRYKVFIYAHNGIDYAGPAGTPVLAAHPGTVQHGSDPTGYGLFVKIIGKVKTTIYAHLRATSTPPGAYVNEQDQIGELGDSGDSTGNHLHFGARLNDGSSNAYGGWIDPKPFRTDT